MQNFRKCHLVIKIIKMLSDWNLRNNPETFLIFLFIFLFLALSIFGISIFNFFGFINYFLYAILNYWYKMGSIAILFVRKQKVMPNKKYRLDPVLCSGIIYDKMQWELHHELEYMHAYIRYLMTGMRYRMIEASVSPRFHWNPNYVWW